MKGFDKEFQDLPDYIIRVTERIWEGRQVDTIRRYYGEQCPVRSPSGVVIGSEAVVSATLSTLAEFPDRRLLPEDIIWSGSPESGFLSSHRILSTATHDGDGAYGRATGKKLRYRIIADCVVQENRVLEEWLVRDQGAIARGLGMTPQQLAQAQIAKGDSSFFTPDNDIIGNYKPRISNDTDAVAYLDLWKTLWRADLSRIPTCYHGAAILYAPSGMEHAGHTQIDHFHLGWLAALADAEFQAEELTVTDNENGKTVAMRWTVRGLHSGAGALAANSKGSPLHIMGISHARFAGGKITAEWVLVDEVALWKQILTAHIPAT